ncbi:uncharacterized protein [Setaria viridis]|uniref:Cathepsin propeptide inhibitor domain-containing protein n=1 Tax=Setaria viridis TaxID=4556 RepID=A0A4U6SW00_SETVI|nr:uncharacterized protein LOC117839806 [Setaria viridis]TKV92651.1 hypothetical protein SEVIR_9G174200v2 [Setaria viridis]
MALRSLCSLVRGATRARTCSSSPGIAVQGALGLAAGSEAAALHGLRNLVYHVDAQPFLAAAVISRIPGSRGLHNLAATKTAQSIRARAGYFLPGIVVQASMGLGSGARRFHSLRDLVMEHAHGSPAALIVAAFSVFAGISNMIDTDESDKARTEEDTEAEARTEEDPSMRTDAYLRYMQASKDMLREMASYNKALPGKNPIDEVALDQEGMKNDEAMRARFEDWMKQYGRTYQDEEEKARRFKIFKAVARSCRSRNPKIEKAPLVIIHKLVLT